jgi:hypothetical protein
MNAAEAQLEVARHLAEAQQQLTRAVLACGDYLYLTRTRQQLEVLEQENGPDQRDGLRGFSSGLTNAAAIGILIG